MTPRRPSPVPMTPRIEIHPLWCDCAVCAPPVPSTSRLRLTFRSGATALAAGIITGMALSAAAALIIGGPGPLVIFGL